MSLINCKNVSIGYDNKGIVKNLDFVLNNGDYLSIIGENGSGKSTLIKTILGLIKPVKGKIEFNVKQNEIGYLPQQTTNQKDFPASVYEVVLSGCLNRKGINPFYNKKDKELVLKNLKKLKISNLINKCYKELSGGQQQRVLLARALCATNSVILLDEPTAGLDINATKDFYDIINKLNKEDKITIIMVSHDIEAAINYSDKLLHIHKNHQFFGTVYDFLESDSCKCINGGAQND